MKTQPNTDVENVPTTYEIQNIKESLESINTYLDDIITQHIYAGKIDDTHKLRKIKNKNIETLMTITEMEYKGII